MLYRDGDADGEALGLPLGDVDGDLLGDVEGLADGLALGDADGESLGLALGLAEGATVLSQHEKCKPVTTFGQQVPSESPRAAHRACARQ